MYPETDTSPKKEFGRRSQNLLPNHSQSNSCNYSLKNQSKTHNIFINGYLSRSPELELLSDAKELVLL